jgi:hypothetical protein
MAESFGRGAGAGGYIAVAFGLWVVLVIGLWGVFAVGQAQAWSAAVAMSPRGNVSVLGEGVGPKGGAIAAWETQGGHPLIQARIRRPDGSLGFTKEIAHPSDVHFRPQMQTSPFGFPATATTAVFTWDGFDGSNSRVELRTLTLTGALGPVITATPPNRDVNAASFQSDASGNIFLAWEDNHRIRVRTVHADGSLGPITTVSPPGERSQDPAIAVNRGGEAAIAWERSSDATVHAVIRQPDESVGPVLDIGKTQGLFTQVGIDSLGEATFFLAGEDRSVVRQLYSGWLHPRLIVDRGSTSTPAMATSSDEGRTIFAWSTASGLRTRSLTGSGRLSRSRTITASGQTSDPDVAINPNGEWAIAWKQVTGRRSDANVVQRGSRGAIGSIHLLGSDDQDPPQVALYAYDAVAAWTAPRGAPRAQISVNP